jgi:ribose 5-phosphate isomerase A
MCPCYERKGKAMMAGDQQERKRRVASEAAKHITSGMRVGLGSGSTVNLVVAALGERLYRGDLHDLKIVVASTRTEAAMAQAGLPLATLDEYPELDLAIDGADEVDPQFAMIKGGGGALLRERIVLAAAAERLIVIDESKVVSVLGTRWAVPVEVVRFGWRVAERALRTLGSEPVLRTQSGVPAITDEGDYILDCAFGPISDPERLAARIAGQPGVVAHGIFIDLVDRLLIAGSNGVETCQRPTQS